MSDTEKALTLSQHSSVEKPLDVEKSETRSELSGSFVPDPKLERSAYRKLDWYVLPVVTMFYLLSFLVSPASKSESPKMC